MSDIGLLAVKSPTHSKMRLSAIMNNMDRERLALSLFANVLDCFVHVFSGPHILVVSGSPEMLSLATQKGATAVFETCNGQNEALTAGARLAKDRGARRLVSASSDLPFLSPEDVRQLLSVTQRHAVAIAPDRHGRGTNAIGMSPPLAIAYLHGDDSFQSHCAATKNAGLVINLVERPGLSHDLDDAEDFRDFFPGRFDPGAVRNTSIPPLSGQVSGVGDTPVSGDKHGQYAS